MVFQCIGCESSFREKINLKQHMRQRHGFKKYKCNQCNFCSDEQCNVMKHVKFLHENINFKCDQCDFKCVWKDNLKQHIKLKHLEKKMWYGFRICLVTLHCLVFCNHNYICFHQDIFTTFWLLTPQFLQICRNHIIFPVL
mgnify:CR=1 FL=1